MPNRDRNSGLIISGNAAFQSDVTAIGCGASASKIVHDAATSENEAALEAIREQLARLSEQVHQSGHLVGPSTKEAIDIVIREADKPQPNKLVMSSILDGVSGAAKSVASIGSAILAITKLIATL